MTHREQDAIVASWRSAFGSLTVLAYVMCALVVGWRPADVLADRIGYGQIPLNVLALWIAYYCARRAGTRFARWRLLTAYGIDPDAPPAHPRRDPSHV